MEEKSDPMVFCSECNMFTVLPEEKANFTCHKCKLVSLLEEKVRSLEERVSTLKLTRDAEAQTEEPLLIHEEKENPSVPVEAAEWKQVSRTRRRARRLSAPIELKNQYQVLMQEKQRRGAELYI
uniref:Uncharacterized protein n=1 Tax=Micrurus lemniscatus lemniscatus TaxID=129467 RepID=A0A2D4HUR8_MICLE